MARKITAPLWLVALLLVLTLTGCYHRNPRSQHAALVEYSDRQRDSISFYSSHHYTNKYNFVVVADSLMLMRQQPEEFVNNMPTDTFAVGKHRFLVVSDIRMIPQDSIDSVWVQLATEENEFGWTRESRLLPSVVPDDPISQFIFTFSNVHLLIFLIVFIIISLAYLVRKICHTNAHIVHFNDIDSPYPTALVLTVSLSAAYYATIQMCWPEMWRHFYFHPSLNPFAVPYRLGLFLISVWAILIVAIACVDEVSHKMNFSDGMLYMGGLVGVCALDYILFSVTTLYYVGYVLLAAYFVFAVWKYQSR